MTTDCKLQGLLCPCHGAQFINGRTLVYFENFDIGVVQNFDPDKQTFEVHMTSSDYVEGEIRQYTVSQLLEEMKMDVCHGQADGVECPPLKEE